MPLLNNQFDGKYEFIFIFVAQLYFGLSPFPEIVTTRIITCLVSGILLKLLLGSGTTQLYHLLIS